MKKRIMSIMLSLLMVASVMGCGSKDVETVSENKDTENTEVTERMEDTAEEVVESDIVKETVEEVSNNTYTEGEYVYILDGVYNDGPQFDLDSLEFDNREFTLEKSVDIYYTDTSLAGYTKENVYVYVVSSNDEWCFCSFGNKGYLIKTDELMTAVAKEEEVEIVKEDTPSTNETVADTSPVVETPATEQPVEEQPVVTNNKYTPEEAISIYRSIMESNGITWDPSLKNGGSWGTGFFLLDKGWIDENAYSSVESFRMGDSVGNPWTKYYLEITSSDENYVYFTEWAD